MFFKCQNCLYLCSFFLHNTPLMAFFPIIKEYFSKKFHVRQFGKSQFLYHINVCVFLIRQAWPSFWWIIGVTYLLLKWDQWKMSLYFIKKSFRACWGNSAAKSTNFSSRESTFTFQHPHSEWLRTIHNSSPGSCALLWPSWALHDILYRCPCLLNTHAHKINPSVAFVPYLWFLWALLEKRKCLGTFVRSKGA